MPPAGRIEAAERAERAAAGPSRSQGRGASDAVGCQQGSSYFSVEFYNVRTDLRLFKPEPY